MEDNLIPVSCTKLHLHFKFNWKLMPINKKLHRGGLGKCAYIMPHTIYPSNSFTYSAMVVGDLEFEDMQISLHVLLSHNELSLT